MAPPVFSHTLHIVLHICLLFRISTPSPVTLNENGPLRRADQTRQTGVFSVLGVAGLGDTSVYPRLEVRELERNADQWNIYLLGLKRFQETGKDDRLSYYQIAGIHGRPYTAWDGVNQGPGGSGGGYCPHGANIFPTWHRPFLVLFEELLYLNARQVVSEFSPGPLRDKYSAALATFRMPYWDWAAVPPEKEGSMPWSVQKPTVDVVFPNGTAGTIPNPLFAYRFPSGADLGDAPFSTWPTTLRDPSSTEANAASRNDLVALELEKNRKSLQSRVYNVLAMQHDYANVSNDLQPGDNFESVHDTIHNTIGSDGHMSFLAIAAFDPIFWLHHTNVDRLFAIWQALNPNSYVTPMLNPYATFTEKANSIADVNTPLTPFHRDDSGKIWTSDGVRSTSTFGYTYPELVHFNFNSNDTSSLILKVNKLYGPNAGHQKRAALDSRAVAGAPNFSGQRQYVTNIRVKKFSGIGSFNIYVFLGGEPGADAKDWVKKASFIGVTGMLSQPMQPDNPKADIEAHGAVPLTAALEQKVRGGELESMEEDTVANYLNRNLKWRIATMKGDLIPVEQAPGFQISVLWVPVKPAESASEFPQMVGDYQVLVAATDGLPGGFWKGDTVPSGGY